MGRPRKNNFAGFFGFLKSLFTVAVLTAFVLGISLFVKNLATSDTNKLLSKLDPVWAILHLDNEKVGSVAGAFIDRVSQTGVVEEDKKVGAVLTKSSDEVLPAVSPKDVEFSVAILGDSHGYFAGLAKALSQAKSADVQRVFFLGDYTELGVIDDLTAAKKVMDSGGVKFDSLPGDHDLWKSVGPQNFIDVFGKNYFSVEVGGYKFVGIDNSANYTVITPELMSWFGTEVKDADFVLLSQPLYHPSLNVVMGVVNGQVNQSVKAQADELLKLVRGSGVVAIIAGDQHLSSQNNDPEDVSLKHIVVGAITEERNLQTPRFGILNILKNGDFAFEDVLVQ